MAANGTVRAPAADADTNLHAMSAQQQGKCVTSESAMTSVLSDAANARPVPPDDLPLPQLVEGTVEAATAPNAAGAKPAALHSSTDEGAVVSLPAPYTAADAESTPITSKSSRPSRARMVAQTLLTSEVLGIAEPALVHDVAAILKSWAERWEGAVELRSLIEMPSLLHEVEESLVAAHLLLQRLGEMESGPEGISVVDLCAGKGVFSMLLSYLAGRRPWLSGPLRSILTVERSSAEQINWHHIDAANADVKRRRASAPRESSRGLAAVPIELCSGCSIHDADIEERLRKLPGRLAVVGIHLCRRLSPRCVGLFNQLGAARASVLILAPCCLPRTSGGTIPVPLFEKDAARAARLEALRRRAHTARRRRTCWHCGALGHQREQCESDAAALLRSAKADGAELLGADTSTAPTPCWRCGEFGHKKSECTTAQSSRRPPLVVGPVVELDVQAVGRAANPFDAWCEALRGAVQSEPGEVEVCKYLLTSEGKGDLDDRNWNRHRKCSWIVCQRSPHTSIDQAAQMCVEVASP